MAKYRKLPVVIEAQQFIDENKNQVLSWARSFQFNIHHSWDKEGNPTIVIPTLEGDMTASFGDWIIRGANGELYPCNPEIFEKTYKPIVD